MSEGSGRKTPVSQEWDDCYREGRQMTAWPWTDLVSYVMRYGRPDRPDFAILEIGCGAGTNIPFFLTLNAQYYAVEGSSFMVARLKEKYPELAPRIACADFTREIPFDRRFDLVVDRGALMCNKTPEMRSGATQVKQHLVSGGKVIGVDWPSMAHYGFTQGEATEDPYTRTNYPDGPWATLGTIHFCDVNGEPPEKAIVTGNPAMDDPEKALEVNTSPKEVREQLGIHADSRLVLYVGQPYVGLSVADSYVRWEKQLATVLSVVPQVDDCSLVLRPHPTEKNEQYQEIAERLGVDDYVFDRRRDLTSLINASDLVILRNSTVSLDVLMLGKRLLILDLCSYEQGIPFGEIGGIPEVKKSDELATAIENALASRPDPEKVDRFIAQQIHRENKPPTQVMYDRLFELAEEFAASRKADDGNDAVSAVR